MQAEHRHLERARLLISQSRFDLAEREARQSIGADPELGEAYALLALCLAERNEWNEASLAADRAVGLEPSEPYHHYVRARILCDRNMASEARDALGASLELDPTNPSAWALLARIELGAKQHQKALDAAERGLEQDAEHEACVNLRAIALTQLGKREDATKAIDATLSRNPLSAVSHANMGWTLLHQRKARPAMEHFREALRLDPTMEWARYGIVEAMKARNFIYRIFLAYFLFMSRLGRNASWGIIIGAWLVFKISAGVGTSYPAAAPYVTVIKVLYMTFAIGTVVSVPLFNLFLFLDPFGRVVLSRQQRWAALAFGVSLLPPLAMLVAWGLTRNNDFGVCAIYLALVPIPVSLAGLTARSSSRRVLAAIAGITLLSGAAICWFAFNRPLIPEELGIFHVLACVGSTWISNILGSRAEKRLG